MQVIKYATTFGGSEYGIDSSEYTEGILLGKSLAELGYIVKCGGYYGLMEAVAKGVVEADGHCIGVTNASFDPKTSNHYISEERKCNDIFDRLRELIKDSEVFIIQHGSLGTLTELFLVWCLCYTNTIQNKKIYLIGSAWKDVMGGLTKLPIKHQDYNRIVIFKNIEQLLKVLNKK